MKILIAAIGRLKSGPEFDLVEDYAARVRAVGKSIGVSAIDIRDFEAPKGLDGARRREREAEMLRAAASNAAKLIVLDESGRSLTSEALAAQIGRWRDDGVPELAFLIGGADGHHPALSAEADLRLSFGQATFPHMLVRAMLSEQIYRVATILSGHPYHRA